MNDDIKMLELIHDDQNVIYVDTDDERKQAVLAKLKSSLTGGTINIQNKIDAEAGRPKSLVLLKSEII